MEESNTPKSQDNTTDGGDNRQNSGAFPNAVDPIEKNPPPPRKGGESSYHHHPTPWWKRFPLQMLIEIAVFIVGIRVACIYSGQLDAMRKANELAYQSMNAQTRPWVGLEKPATIDRTSPELARTHYFVENFGHSAALNVRPESFFAVEGDDLTILSHNLCNGAVRFATGETHPQGPIGNVLFPNQVAGDYGDNESIRSSAWNDFSFIGCIAYLDERRNVHWTRFCMEPDPDTKPTNPASVPLRFCAQYNDTDETAEKR